MAASRLWRSAAIAALVLTALTITFLVVRNQRAPEAASLAQSESRTEAAAQEPSSAASEHTTETRTGATNDEELVTHLQSLLSHHATLSVRFMRATVSGDPSSFVDTAYDALVRNTTDLEQALRPAVGTEEAAGFGAQWERHTQALFEYATGVRNDDDAAKQQAERELARSRRSQSALLAEASGGRIAREDVDEALETYDVDLLEQIEDYDAGQYQRAYALQRDAYALTFPLGETLGQGLSNTSPPQPDPVDELHTALAQLLGEHVELAIEAMRAGVAGAPDFDAAAGALDENTRDVTNAMDALFGAERAQQFNEVWADHIDLFVQYTVAVGEGDEQAKRDIRARFDDVIARFGTTLAETTGGQIEASVVNDAMASHEEHLVEQIEVYAASDFGQAHSISYTAYQHIREVADTLATAFAEAVESPVGGSDTGAGGTANVRRYRSVRNHVTAAEPANVEIPAIDVSSDLQALGRDADGAIEVPDAWQQAGWYAEGTKPGQPGPAVILGHVDSRQGPAVFFRLRELSRGDRVEVSLEDGSVVTFVVDRVERHAKTEFPTDDVYLPTLKPTLRLVTCGGTFDHSTRHYRDNIVVFADLVDSAGSPAS